MCPPCARIWLKLRNNVTRPQLYTAKEPPTSVCIDSLGPLISISRKNEYLLVITEMFLKTKKTMPMKDISAAEVTKHFVNVFVFNYIPPELLVFDNDGCFTSKFFHDVCRIMYIKNNFKKTFHLQTNRKVEKYNRTILAALWTYLSDNPLDWYLYTDALTYAYNSQTHTPTSVAPIELVLLKTSRILDRNPMPTSE